MLERLLEQFDAKRRQLETAVRLSDNDDVVRLDRELDDLLQRIVDYETRSRDDWLTLCRFLVGQMMQYDAHSPAKELIATRLLGLFEQSPGNEKLPVASASE